MLDALETLGAHRRAVILVGAQAVYVHTGEVSCYVSPFTYDADLAIDPSSLADEPPIIDAMAAAGFHLRGQPGLYSRSDGTEVDLLVPDALGGSGRRGARLGVHGSRAAMKVRGLEGCLVDHGPVCLTALGDADTRRFFVEVAGPGALLVAKLHKLAERAQGALHRQDDKDAFDIYRMLRVIQTSTLAKALMRLQVDQVSGMVTKEAVEFLGEYFGNVGASGTQMVVRHVAVLEDPEFIAASCVALASDLLEALGGQSATR